MRSGFVCAIWQLRNINDLIRTSFFGRCYASILCRLNGHEDYPIETSRILQTMNIQTIEVTLYIRI